MFICHYYFKKQHLEILESTESEETITKLIRALMLEDNEPELSLRKLPDNCYPILLNNTGRGERLLVANPMDYVILDAGVLVTSTQRYEDNFWHVLPHKLQEHAKKHVSTGIIAPYFGYYGFLSYELGRLLEEHKHRDDESIIPEIYFILPSLYLIFSRNLIKIIKLDAPIVTPKVSAKFIPQDNISNTHISEYTKNVSRIIEYIHAGDIYQANYTQKFQVQKQLNAREEFLSLISRFHVNHDAYVETGAFEILSISPELFLSIRERKVITKPIKGTRPRGKTMEEDERLSIELLNSKKDQAELSMIVDLLRNDLGKSCHPASVSVEKHAALESYTNVHHLVSTVTATIDANPEAAWKLLLRAFPGGSITGVPKLRAMEIIEETENTPRGIYTGSIGYLALNGDTEFNIAIRTITSMNKHLIFNAGGGIVADSDPTDEFIESLHKAKHIAKYFGYGFTGEIALHNGKYVTVRNAPTINSNRGFFETIRIKQGTIQHHELHEQRMKRGIDYYQIRMKFPEYEELAQLAMINLAYNARMKLMVYHDQGVWNYYVQIFPYTEPEEIELMLNTYSTFEGIAFQEVEKGFKPIRYGEYAKYMREGISHGVFDSLIVSNGYILEGGRSTFYFKLQNQWYTPEKFVVQGTIRSKMINEYRVNLRDISVQELDMVTAIAASNALIGIQPVKRIINALKQVIWQSESNEIP
ncbi:MAG: bifunctional anthranilate synthase component I family protein/class IV aminotransferase [Candidatus Heimdallarchaeota archaeon]|nr:bifunctional anthranilate synthase component I family protein/class IV aminotransferase [Candidatus Heimdallarchaeota archaeon]